MLAPSDGARDASVSQSRDPFGLAFAELHPPLRAAGVRPSEPSGPVPLRALVFSSMGGCERRENVRTPQIPRDSAVEGRPR